MSLRVTITVTGDKAAMAKVKSLGAIETKLKAAFILVGKEAVTYYQTTGFTDQGRPWGQQWAPLSPRYKKLKEKRYAGRPTLVATGEMQDSFEASASVSSVAITNRARQYKYHQSSASRKGHLPRRQMAGINNPIKRIVQEALHNEIVKQIRMA